MRYPLFLLAMATMLATAGSAGAQDSARSISDEFFIISSVNLPKRQLVLKLPTEVTMKMTATAKTVILDETGKSLQLGALRSGDTGYFSYTQGGLGAVATKIRLGPMTVNELRRRYLGGLSTASPAEPLSRPRAKPRPASNVERGRDG